MVAIFSATLHVSHSKLIFHIVNFQEPTNVPDTKDGLVFSLLSSASARSAVVAALSSAPVVPAVIFVV